MRRLLSVFSRQQGRWGVCGGSAPSPAVTAVAVSCSASCLRCCAGRGRPALKRSCVAVAGRAARPLPVEGRGREDLADRVQAARHRTAPAFSARGGRGASPGAVRTGSALLGPRRTWAGARPPGARTCAGTPLFLTAAVCRATSGAAGGVESLRWCLMRGPHAGSSSRRPGRAGVRPGVNGPENEGPGGSHERLPFLLFRLRRAGHCRNGGLESSGRAARAGRALLAAGVMSRSGTAAQLAAAR